MEIIDTSRLGKVQRTILTYAAEHADGVCLRPNRTSQTAARAAVGDLLALKLLRAIKARDGLPAWYTDDAGRSVSLLLTRRGRDIAAQITSAAKIRSTVSRSGQSSSQPLRADSKIARVIDLIGRDEGASLPELLALTGWLRHTTRAAMTGLRKRGYAVVLERGENDTAVYRIVAASQPLTEAA